MGKGVEWVEKRKTEKGKIRRGKGLNEGYTLEGKGEKEISYWAQEEKKGNLQ